VNPLLLVSSWLYRHKGYLKTENWHWLKESSQNGFQTRQKEKKRRRRRRRNKISGTRWMQCLPFKCLISILKAFRKPTIGRNMLCYRLVFHNIRLVRVSEASRRTLMQHWIRVSNISFEPRYHIQAKFSLWIE